MILRWFVRLGAAGLLLAATPAQAADVPAPVWKAYRHAIEVSSRIDQDPVVRDLVRLTRSDRRVRWRTIDGHEYVLVATFRRDALSTVNRGQQFELTGPKWVVVPRQLRSRCLRVKCRSMGAAKLDLTIKQFIGLPPDADYSVVNTFWARPRDIFRPCRRPGVRTSSCPRRTDGPLPTVNGVSVRNFLRGQARYAWRWPRAWNPSTAVSCASAWPEPADCYGFPWTELGYTYDWARDRSKVGLSEFVVTGGSRVYLNREQSQRQFIAWGDR